MYRLLPLFKNLSLFYIYFIIELSGKSDRIFPTWLVSTGGKLPGKPNLLKLVGPEHPCMCEKRLR
jgi:hypothetical protein